MTFQHRAGVSPYTSPFGFAETCVFDKQSPGPFHCDLHRCRHPFSRSYGVIMPSSLTTLLPLALGFSPHLPVSVCGTGTSNIPQYFSRHNFLMLVLNRTPLRLGFPSPGSYYGHVSYCLNSRRPRNLYRVCIDYAFRPRLSSRLTLGGRTYPRKPQIFGHCDSRAILATHSGILTSVQSTSASALASPRTERSPTQYFYCPSFGYILSPVKSSAQRHSTSELLRTL